MIERSRRQMAGDTMIQRLEMKVLIDNVAEGSLVGEWGLSIMIDADDMRILLDTGASGLFAQNAD
jgi:7,8-dihydropterin-6-yl-methyl-4-(beta-D-ribofuranosyl)aminobenzene 5'-phosphate synthase